MLLALSATMVLLTLTALRHLGDTAPADVVLRAGDGEPGRLVAASAASAAPAPADRGVDGVRGAHLEALEDLEALEASVIAVPATAGASAARAAPPPPRPSTTVAKRPKATTSTTTTANPRATTTTARPRPTTTTTVPPTTVTTAPRPANVEEGLATWYAAVPGTCAHRTAPMGTILTVTSLADGSRATCRVADRGPFVDGRIVDLAREDFSLLARASEGVIRVRVEW